MNFKYYVKKTNVNHRQRSSAIVIYVFRERTNRSRSLKIVIYDFKLQSRPDNRNLRFKSIVIYDFNQSRRKIRARIRGIDPQVLNVRKKGIYSKN